MARADVKLTTDLDSSKMQASLARTKNSVGKFAKGVTARFLALGAVIAGMRGLGSLGKLAMEAEEVNSKFNAVFGNSAKSLSDEIVELKKHIHGTRTEIKNSLATFGAMGKGMGLTEDATKIFSKSLLKLQGDLASFHDLNADEAFTKIKSAVSGEYEPMKQLGIVLNEATVKQEALNMGIYDGTTALTASQKAIAVQSLLVAKMGEAVGDAEATSKSSMNSYKRLNREFKELGETIGVLIIPLINKLVGITSKAVEGFGNLTKMQENSKSAFKDQAEANLLANGMLKKTWHGYTMTKKALNEYNMSMGNQAKVTDMVTGEIKKLSDAQEKLNLETGKRSDEQIADDNIRAENLKEQKDLIDDIKDAMGDTFEKQQDELRASEQKIKDAKELLNLEKKRIDLLDEADTNMSGTVSNKEKREQEKQQRELDKKRREVLRLENNLDSEFGGEEKARRKEESSKFGSLENPYTDAGKALLDFQVASRELMELELNKIMPNRLKGQPKISGVQKGGVADKSETKSENKDLSLDLKEMKGLSKTTDTNIEKIKSLMDKIDGALT